MPALYNFSMTEVLAFALVLLRMAGFVVTMPIFGTANVPVQVKILFAFIMTIVIFPQIGWKAMSMDIDSLMIMTLAAKEVFVGLVFGYLARLFFISVTMAGQIMSVSLGLSAAQLFDPMMGESSTSFDQFFVILASIFFLAINGHHIMIAGIFDSFTLVPLNKIGLSFTPFGGFGIIAEQIMAIAVKMSAPILISILFMNVAIAVIGRAVPQINILITSLPLNILAGFFILFLALPLLLWQMHGLVNVTADELFRFVKAL